MTSTFEQSSNEPSSEDPAITGEPSVRRLIYSQPAGVILMTASDPLTTSQNFVPFEMPRLPSSTEYPPQFYRALHDLAAVIGIYSNPQETLFEALKIVAQTVRAEYGVLLQHDVKSDLLVALRPVYCHNSSATLEAEAELEASRIGLAETSVSAQAYLSRQSIYLNHLEQVPEISRSHIANVKIRNELAIPIVVENRVQGVCLLINKIEADFQDQDAFLLNFLSGPLASLFKNLTMVNLAEQQQRRHLAVMDAAVDGLIEVSRDMRITMFSKGAENLTGWQADEVLGRTCHEILLPHSPDKEPLCNNCPLRRAFRFGTPVTNVETLIHSRDDEDNWVSTSYSAVTDERGQVVSGIITIKDIYRLKALSDELGQQAQQLESLLGVNNAINGLSNIEEIYRVSLDAISTAINFDLGAIHAVKGSEDLVLVSLLEKETTRGSSEAGNNETSPVRRGQTNAAARVVQPAQPLTGLGGLGLSQEEEEYQKHTRQRSRRTGPLTPITNLAVTNQKPGLHLHRADECEALRHNEPYMSVNLPGKPVCGVLSEFEGLQSHLCVPIKTNERTYGILHLASRQPYAFWGSDFVLALSICKQIAVGAERARLFEQIDRLARTDALTGLYNKREFWERIEREIRRADRRQSPLSLMLIDLDRLKWINDCFGHSEGDAVLTQLSDIIRMQCRASDIAFRYGGDELCILLPDTNQDEARIAAERLRQAVYEIKLAPHQDDLLIGNQNLVTMSIGITCYYAGQEITAPQLFENVDAAMYRAKETGKDRAVIFDRQIDYNRLNYRRRQTAQQPEDNRLAPPRQHTTGLLSAEP